MTVSQIMTHMDTRLQQQLQKQENHRWRERLRLEPNPKLVRKAEAEEEAKHLVELQKEGITEDYRLAAEEVEARHQAVHQEVGTILVGEETAEIPLVAEMVDRALEVGRNAVETRTVW